VPERDLPKSLPGVGALAARIAHVERATLVSRAPEIYAGTRLTKVAGGAGRKVGKFCTQGEGRLW
jgi:hypothetical protein